MKRRTWIACAAALISCGRRKRDVEIFPTAIGGWTRTSLRDAPLSEMPDPVPESVVRRVQVAMYEGPGRIEARAYELASPEVGVDLAQGWRPSADTVFFWAQRYFVVVKWEQAERSALRQFTTAIEKRIKGG